MAAEDLSLESSVPVPGGLQTESCKLISMILGMRNLADSDIHTASHMLNSRAEDHNQGALMQKPTLSSIAGPSPAEARMHPRQAAQHSRTVQDSWRRT